MCVCHVCVCVCVCARARVRARVCGRAQAAFENPALIDLRDALQEGPQVRALAHGHDVRARVERDAEGEVGVARAVERGVHERFVEVEDLCVVGGCVVGGLWRVFVGLF